MIYKVLQKSIQIYKNLIQHILKFYKEVFVKHDKAPTAPKLEGVWFM